ncbi:MAG: hypothetical protein K1Y01_04770 [Vicinamibacteria bacterium]|nr:hypothetical protein [Vicinamibacteria bacterium]
MRSRLAGLLLAAALWATVAGAQPEAPGAIFRRGNEHAARSRWDDAIGEYGRLAREGVKAPSLFWNWAQAATAAGRRGEALWALMSARELTPGDASMIREIERLRGELGLDPSEISLGFLGDLRALARRFRFDAIALTAFFFSILAVGRKSRSFASLVLLVAGILLLAPFLAAGWREPRGVVVQKDAPLMDAARSDALALANLREGEVVPILGEEGEYVRIQDASGARGFALKNDVRRIGAE